MMSPAIVLLVAVTADPRGISMTKDAAASCVQAMPAGSSSVVRQIATAPSDATLDAAAATAGARAVVVLSWHDTALLITDVRVWPAPSQPGGLRSVFRTVVFSARDLPDERGRALGLVIASMLAEVWTPPVGLAGAGPGVGPPAASEPNRALEPAPTEARRQAPDPADASRWALEAEVATVIDRNEDLDIDTIGAAIGARRTIAPHWALRAAVGFRVGDVDDAVATSRTALAAAGLAWTSARLERARRVAVGARLDVLGAHLGLERSADGSSTNRAGYWWWGLDLLGQAEVALSGATALLGGLGFEEAFTAANIVVSGTPVAEIPHLQIVFEFGVLSRF